MPMCADVERIAVDASQRRRARRADLDVIRVAVPLVHGVITRRDTFDEVRVALARFAESVDWSGGRLFWGSCPSSGFRLALYALRNAVALHDPNGNAVPGFAVYVRRSEAWWTWLLPPVV